MTTARTTPADVGRWLFWVPLRRTLGPDRQAWLRLLQQGWRLRSATGRDSNLMLDEFRRCFGPNRSDHDYQAMVRDSYRCSWRVHLEELLLDRLDAHNIDDFLALKGREHLDNALQQGRGALWLYPHAGAIMLMLAALSLKGYRYTQYAARGLAPPDVARDHPELLAPNRLREAVRRTREAHEDQLPARYVTLETPVRELVRRLQSNEVVGIAFDGRIGRSWVAHDYLGRQALLSPGPYKMAVLAQSPVLPVFCHTPRDGPSVCEIGEAIEPGSDWRELMHRTVAFQSNRLHEQPEEYGTWMLHCRIRNQIDDHPLFIDHAQDERWKRWLS